MSESLYEKVFKLQSRLAAWDDFAQRLRKSHRAQLPSGTLDLYSGGCGCPQCAEAARLLTGKVGYCSRHGQYEIIDGGCPACEDSAADWQETGGF